MQDTNDDIILNSHVNVVEYMDSSKLDINLNLDYNFVSSTNSIASIVSEESSIYYIPTEFESEDSSSVNHHFVNDSKFTSSCILQVDAVIKFTSLFLIYQELQDYHETVKM